MESATGCGVATGAGPSVTIQGVAYFRGRPRERHTAASGACGAR